MKWMLLVLGIGWQLPLHAVEQYSTYQCDNLKARLNVIKKRSSSGYDIDVNQFSVNKDLALLHEYSLYCVHPVDTVRVIRGAISDAQSAEFPETSLQDMPSFSANNATFGGEKAAAWDDFYQVPRQCRKKQLSEFEFVACAEDKADQRVKFEQNWQPQQSVKSQIHESQSASIMPPKPVVSVPSTTNPATVVIESEQSLLQYLQTLDEQNQRFKWYGLVMLLLMAVAAWLAWRP